MNKSDQKIIEAAKCYILRKDRLEHPEGSFDFLGRWSPSKKEKCSACGCVRRPSKSFPLTHSQHCRTAKHIALKYKVNRSDLLRMAKKLISDGYKG